MEKPRFVNLNSAEAAQLWRVGSGQSVVNQGKIVNVQEFIDEGYIVAGMVPVPNGGVIIALNPPRPED